MPNVTYFKPNRTRIRTFKTCDAVRICREVLSHDDTTPEELLACIAKSMGFTHISLSRPTTSQAAIINLPAAIGTVPVIIRKVVGYLALLVKKYGWLAPVLKEVIDGLDKIRKIIDSMGFTDPDQVKVDDAINKDKCNCKKMVLLPHLKSGANEHKLKLPR
jgi:hypothetical protein